MIIAIRISGLVEMPQAPQETLFRMRLRRKYSAIILESTPSNLKLLQSVRNFIAYGDINPETLALLVEKRGVAIDKKKVDTKKVLEQLEKKGLEGVGLKPFFRLHPPRGGIDSKLHYPIRGGVLGDNKKDINELIGRML
ncbi:MAG: 50S ribosomal protein L30 [Nanoarchaeota archaeon]